MHEAGGLVRRDHPVISELDRLFREMDHSPLVLFDGD